MKKQIAGSLAVAVLSFCCLFAVTTSASAFTVSNGATNVGGLDFFLDSAIVNSGDQNELDWVNGYLKAKGYITADYTSMVKYNNEGILSSSNTEVPGIWDWRFVDGSSADKGTPKVMALDLQGAPEYFFIKVGNITPNDKNDSPPDHFLFKNVASLNWAVIDLSSFGDGFVLKEYGVLSHLGEFGGGGGGTPVPEPASMILLGAGLLGLAVYGKRRMNK